MRPPRDMSEPSVDRFYGEIGECVRALRVRRGLTQAELAGHIGLTRTSITNIEQGKQKLLAHTLLDLAIALEVGLLDLVPSRSDKSSNIEMIKPDHREMVFLAVPELLTRP